MANITILDTGYPNTVNNGDIELTTKRANAGSAIELKAVEMTYSRGAGLDVGPSIGKYYTVNKYAQTEVNFASVENPKITISGVLRRNVTTDMDLIVELDKLVQTKGVKILYYNSTTDGYRDITDSIGQLDTYHLSNLTKHFHIWVKSFSIRHASDKMLLKYDLVCEVTADTIIIT